MESKINWIKIWLSATEEVTAIILWQIDHPVLDLPILNVGSKVYLIK